MTLLKVTGAVIVSITIGINTDIGSIPSVIIYFGLLIITYKE